MNRDAERLARLDQPVDHSGSILGGLATKAQQHEWLLEMLHPRTRQIEDA